MVYQVNHDTLEIVGAGVPSNASIDGKIEEYRKAVESAVQFYADGYYTEEKTVYSVYAKEQTLYIVISSRNTNLGAMWYVSFYSLIFLFFILLDCCFY